MLALSKNEVDRIVLMFDICLLANESPCFSVTAELSELGYWQNGIKNFIKINLIIVHIIFFIRHQKAILNPNYEQNWFINLTPGEQRGRRREGGVGECRQGRRGIQGPTEVHV
jgi:hypothetical protein